jgi:hypothetical protein
LLLRPLFAEGRQRVLATSIGIGLVVLLMGLGAIAAVFECVHRPQDFKRIAIDPGQVSPQKSSVDGPLSRLGIDHKHSRAGAFGSITFKTYSR